MSTQDEIAKKNEALKKSFDSMKETVRRIQYWIEDERHRVHAITDFQKDERVSSLIEQLGTSFCVISRGTNPEGEDSIVISLDKNIQDKIGHYFTVVLLRRLFEFTPEFCDFNVRLWDLSKDCEGYMETVIEEAKRGIGHHKITLTPYEGDQIDELFEE